MAKQFNKDYKFFPRTYLLPAEYGEFRNSFLNKTGNAKPVYIVKPEASCQGKGIFLTNEFEALNPEDHYVV
jgi:tubulin polyglutamylase TTLL6/13